MYSPVARVSRCAVHERVEEVQPLLVRAEDLREDSDGLEPRDLVEEADVGLDRVRAEAAVEVVRVDTHVARSASVAGEHLQVARLGHVAVVVDPRRIDAPS